MKLHLGSKVAAVAIAVALLGQPVVAASLCWEMATVAAACAGHCPMPQKPGHTDAAKVKAADPLCCEISSSEPAPLATVAVNVQKTATPPLPLVNLAAANADILITPVAKESPPANPVSSLNTLYCVFLI